MHQNADVFDSETELTSRDAFIATLIFSRFRLEDVLGRTGRLVRASWVRRSARGAVVMELLFSIFFPLLLLGGIVGIAIWNFRSMGEERATYRSAALAQFEAWQNTSGAAQLLLTPGQCELVKESESVVRNRSKICSYTLTRFLRNASGQYYMFKSTPTGPYVKSVSVEVAKVVLKEKFVP